MISRGLAGVLLALLAQDVSAEVYVTPEAFVAQSFDGAPPAPAVLWPAPAVQQQMQDVLGHPYRLLRIRYWQQGERTAWVLREVGKEEEITIGFLVAESAIRDTQVLEFRESRGWEIKFPSFTKQFFGTRLVQDDALDRPIDNITGATLSVGAYQRLARLALVLDRAVRAPAP